MSAFARYRVVYGTVAAVLLIAIGAWVMVFGGGGSTVEPASAVQSPAAGEASSPVSTEDVTLSAADQPDAKAPRSIGSAKRVGVAVDSDLTVPDRPFGSPAEYADGLRVQVSRIAHETVETVGPGALVGPVTVFTLKVTSESSSPVDLNTVVVTAVYGGTPGLLADPSYDVPVNDLAGTLKSGGSSSARYAFSIPADALSDVDLHVDLDGKRLPAVFTGTTQP